MPSRLAVLVLLAACTPAASAPSGDTDGGQNPPATPDDGLIPVELATVGMDALQHTPVVLLREGGSGRIVPILVGVAEAQAILRNLLGMEMPRPMTHDLLANILQELGVTVEEVVVHDLQESTYIGRILLRVEGEGEVREIDSRPSDALALAVRTDAPIRVAEGLLAEPPRFDFLAPEADEQVVRLLGATVITPTPNLRERYGLGDRVGVVVVGASGEAAEKGLRRGDLIVGVNGVQPTEPMDFLNAALGATDMVEILFWRDGEEHTIELSPAAVPVPAPERRRGPTPIQT
jgi:uncharacterized protein